MATHQQLSDEEFEEAFKNMSLSPTIFNHEAHLRLAWIHINKYGLEKAVDNICTQLLNYVHKWDASDKYNKTVTIAAIKAVYHFKLKSSSTNFSDFIAEFPRLIKAFRSLLGLHYSIDIFKSEEAKKHYLAPDLLPFD